jgi:hypothetical protein
MNETVAGVANAIVPQRRPEEAFTFVCECGRAGCRGRIRLARDEYEAVRVHPGRLVVVGDHQAPERDRVVARHDAYVVVERAAGAALQSVA